MSESKQQEGGRLFKASSTRMTVEVLSTDDKNGRSRFRLRYKGVNMGIFSGEVNEPKTS